MGRRGRQRAKQVKVARDIKYHAVPTDLTALQRELTTTGTAPGPADIDETDGELEGSSGVAG